MLEGSSSYGFGDVYRGFEGFRVWGFGLRVWVPRRVMGPERVRSDLEGIHDPATC